MNERSFWALIIPLRGDIGFEAFMLDLIQLCYDLMTVFTVIRDEIDIFFGSTVHRSGCRSKQVAVGLGEGWVEKENLI